jgi:hypothetical protein
MSISKGVRFFFAACLAILAGCTTYVQGTKKAEGYEGKIRDPLIIWQSTASLQTSITARYAVTTKDRDRSSEGIGKLLPFLSTGSVPAISQKLRANAVPPASLPQDAKFIIKLEPLKGYSDCTVLGCAHDVSIGVSVTDISLRRVVWQGGFKVGAPFGVALDNQVLDNFSEKLVSELKSAKLI